MRAGAKIISGTTEFRTREHPKDRGAGEPPPSSPSGPNPRWLARANLFIRPAAETPVKMCRAGLHNVYETGIRYVVQKIRGKTYTQDYCRLCANEASRVSARKKRAA